MEVTVVRMLMKSKASRSSKAAIAATVVTNKIKLQNLWGRHVWGAEKLRSSESNLSKAVTEMQIYHQLCLILLMKETILPFPASQSINFYPNLFVNTSNYTAV